MLEKKTWTLVDDPTTTALNVFHFPPSRLSPFYCLEHFKRCCRTHSWFTVTLPSVRFISHTKISSDRDRAAGLILFLNLITLIFAAWNVAIMKSSGETGLSFFISNADSKLTSVFLFQCLARQS